MRSGLVAAILAVAAVTATPAAAQDYPWCAIYGRIGGWGATNCGFVTWQQCQATISGVGGYCERNPMYQPPAKRKAKKTKKQGQ